MADIPPSVGWFTVNGRLLLGLADSNDPGSNPDAVAAIADVTITNNAPIPLVAVAEKAMFNIATIKAYLDAEGRLIPPANGLDGEPSVGGEVRLVATDQLAISDVNWGYTFTFTPLPGQIWTAFGIYVSGAPGDVIDLGDAVLAETPTSPAVYPSYIEVDEATEEDGRWTATVPEGTPHRTLVIWQDDNTKHVFLYQ